jgi:hypothetical protein
VAHGSLDKALYLRHFVDQFTEGEESEYLPERVVRVVRISRAPQESLKRMSLCLEG